MPGLSGTSVRPSNNGEPATHMASAAIAGLPMRLLQRLEVRHDPTAASPTAASTAASGPWISSSRKMKVSPAAKEFFERSTRTGKKPASMAMAAPTAVCNQASGGCRAKSPSDTASAQAPSTTTVHQ